MSFTYTYAEQDLDSSVVYEAYYSAPNKELAVVLSSGEGYVYNDVPWYVYDALVASGSPGRYYAVKIKRDYGPGTRLGYVGFENDEQFVSEPVNDYSSAVGTPKNLTYAPGATVTYVNNGNTTHVPLKSESEEKTRYTVIFAVHGSDRAYDVIGETSVEAAKAAVEEIGNALGVELKVKSVTVHFE